MDKFCKKIATYAQKSLLYEVLLTPKPGLVDRNNMGAHFDMNIFTFADSCLSLYDYFFDCTKAGLEYYGDNYSGIMKIIRPRGIIAEKEMYLATGGINTHKGSIFIFGILCAAIGSLKGKNEKLNLENILLRASEIAKIVKSDYEKISDKKSLTYGEKQFLKYGELGIRGEVADAFPSIKKISYPVFLKTLEKTNSVEIAMGNSLLYLMKNIFDSNIVGRGGIEALNFMKKQSEIAISYGGYETEKGIKFIYKMDENFIEKNLSPGGSADLCAATYFLFLCVNL